MIRFPAGLSAVVALQFLAAPLPAQIGLASRPQTVQLSATKLGSVGIALSARPDASLAGGLATGVVTTWNLDPARTASLRLVAFFEGPASFAPSATLVLFEEPIAAGSAVRRRTDALQVRIELSDRPELPPGISPGTLTLVATTQ